MVASEYMKGYIYCFNTHENPNIIKAGHTQQNIHKRLRGYPGPTKPRSIFFQLQVDDSVYAEKMMLTLMRQCASLIQRHDLGNEWFEVSGEFDFHERAAHLQSIATIVQLASRVAPPASRGGVTGEVCVPEMCVPETSTAAEMKSITLRGLESYFVNFDEYVSQDAPACSDSRALLDSYESSSYCEYFCEFLPYSKETRVRVASNRYAHFL